MILVFHLSLSLDRLSTKQTALVQEIGLLTAVSPPDATGCAGGGPRRGRRPDDD